MDEAQVLTIMYELGISPLRAGTSARSLILLSFPSLPHLGLLYVIPFTADRWWPDQIIVVWH